MWLDQYGDGLVQDCSNSIANALELLQSCTEPSMDFVWNQLSRQYASTKTISDVGTLTFRLQSRVYFMDVL